MTDSKLISQEAYDKLAAEIEKLENIDRVAIADRIGNAREDGDLKENAEYHAAKNDQSFLETRILALRDQLRNAEIVETKSGGEEVSFGSTIRLLNSASGKEVSYTIVSSYDQDIRQGRLSVSSPVATAVLGAKKNETVTVKLPSGSTSKFKILEIG